MESDSIRKTSNFCDVIAIAYSRDRNREKLKLVQSAVFIKSTREGKNAKPKVNCDVVL